MHTGGYQPVIVLLGGGHAAGKSTTARAIKDELLSVLPEGSAEVRIVDMSEYADQAGSSIDTSQFISSKSTAITVSKRGKGKDGNDVEDEHNYPILKPSRFNFQKLKIDLNECIKKAKEPPMPLSSSPSKAASTSGSTSGSTFGSTSLATASACSSSSSSSSSSSQPQQIIIVHGLYALYDKELRDMAQIKVFIDSDADTRLIRWIKRDVLGTKSNTLEEVINTYLLGARIEMSDYIVPTKEFADIVMPRGAEPNAVRLVIDGILLHKGEKLTSISAHRQSFSDSHLRPSRFFEKERFDVQKNKFYQLN
ncbi:hypothetical protein PVL30_001699 [Lodderomyces elongisporus]|uniref:Phosphoribulokinase/uridine kinase domain-containing protein n=1 Tax=Lodderomyces elongisporus (strain ATCC 11503 / CBS 2605 / JCM 1781 / NBRC 1676 / NRRL YB-4239) TaxID=379508 RepID=A5DWJ0_LODEL|nr:uncharacterized protein PVL30_001699 [Lodderomyces elongisporus]EDK43548.1 conserved hypothetical protein [Lodderomyces elongisporus NRRL YB-4239]WLF77976.1 hypothetical protein PVL30_001699 [Lodderomyces elongisporus]